MNVRLIAPPWGAPPLTDEAVEAIDLIGSNVWHDASVEFIAERDAKLSAGKTAPKGMQKYINSQLANRFSTAGWSAIDGYFCKESTWVRVTFRHQMSLGSDFLSALKVCRREGIDFAMILAANEETLEKITPNDAKALVSFEKLQREVMNLDGVIDMPLVIGELTPKTNTSLAIDTELRKARPRDKSIPVRREGWPAAES